MFIIYEIKLNLSVERGATINHLRPDLIIVRRKLINKNVFLWFYDEFSLNLLNI